MRHRCFIRPWWNDLRRKPQRYNLVGIKSITVDARSFDSFASCLPGLEPILNHEIRKTLGIENTRRKAGGVGFSGSLDEILQCHLHLGAATNIYVRAGPPFKALGMEELVRKVSKLDWSDFIELPLNQKFDVRVTSTKSRLFHTKGIAERVDRGICKALGIKDQSRNMSSESIIKILVRIYRDEVEISIDTSSKPLHKRGYRLEGAKAPLREDLAYALLYASGFGSDTEAGLLDPFCGSGTIILEGAAMACGLPPGRLRPPPLIGSRHKVQKKWKVMVAEAIKKAHDKLETGALPEILGTDRDKGAIEISNRNAKRAGLSDFVSFDDQAISAVSWFEDPSLSPKKVFVATNPPFGFRIKNSKKKPQLLPLYQTLGHKVSKSFQNFDISIIAHDAKLVRQTGILNLKQSFASQHGGRKVFALGTRGITTT